MGVCTKYCDKCTYCKSFAGGTIPYCDYLCMTGKLRPCPAGDGCSVRVTRRVYRKRPLTEEEKAEREERRRQKKREAKKRSYQKHRTGAITFARFYPEHDFVVLAPAASGRRMTVPNRRYITLETAPELIGKTVDCFKGMGHFYPLSIIQMGKYSQYYVVDRNSVAMPINENDRIPYDFIVKEGGD